jgi:L-lactate dehydrogenase
LYYSSTSPLQGRHGIDKEVFLSLPCVLGENGVNYIVHQKLSPGERAQLQKSANTINEVQNGIKW